MQVQQQLPGNRQIRSPGIDGGINVSAIALSLRDILETIW
jgi:hypothetical protein